jgi:ferric-dicitrate binding protein FerR (iron transport regulator)
MVKHLSRLAFAFAAFAGALVGVADVATAQQTIGQTEVVVASVQGAYGGRVRQLSVSDPVFHDEYIETASDAASQLRFQDGTVLSVGPSSRVALDTFVYDPDPSRQKMVISMTRGVLRFATGRLAKNAYVIATPSATITVRGTVFTVAIDRDGGTTVHVEEGGVRAVNPAGASIEAGAQGSIWLQAPVQGVVPAPIGPLLIGPGGQVVAMDQILEGGSNPTYNGPQPDQFEHYRQHNGDNNTKGGNNNNHGGGNSD